jgi:hypothetical protein
VTADAIGGAKPDVGRAQQRLSLPNPFKAFDKRKEGKDIIQQEI